MNNRTYIFACLLLSLLLIGEQAVAQIGLNKLGIGFSTLERTYSGEDERFFFLTPPSAPGGFTRTIYLPSLSAEVSLWQNFGLEGRVATWNTTFTDISSFLDGLVIRESLNQSVVPLSLLLTYNYAISDKWEIVPGVGVNRFLIQHDVSRQVTRGEGSVPETRFTGSNYGIHLKLGVEYALTPKIALAVEARYHDGSYVKRFTPEPGASIVSKEIDLRGLEFGLVMKYRLKNRYDKVERKERLEQKLEQRQLRALEKAEALAIQENPEEESVSIEAAAESEVSKVEISEEQQTIKVSDDKAVHPSKDNEPVSLEETTSSTVASDPLKVITVGKNETLSAIAIANGVSYFDLIKWNRLENSQLSEGQEIRIYPRSVAVDESFDDPYEIVHIVSRGEFLIGIASGYGVSTADIRRWNRLESNELDAGQQLIIKFSEAKIRQRSSMMEKSVIYHFVQIGDTLFRLSNRYGVSVQSIQDWNDLTSDLIFVGQRLVIYENPN